MKKLSIALLVLLLAQLPQQFFSQNYENLTDLELAIRLENVLEMQRKKLLQQDETIEKLQTQTMKLEELQQKSEEEQKKKQIKTGIIGFTAGFVTGIIIDVVRRI